MNLRELVADLECQGKPEASEFLVAAMNAENNEPMSVKGFRIDEEAETVWLDVDYY